MFGVHATGVTRFPPSLTARKPPWAPHIYRAVEVVANYFREEPSAKGLRHCRGTMTDVRRAFHGGVPYFSAVDRSEIVSRDIYGRIYVQ